MLILEVESKRQWLQPTSFPSKTLVDSSGTHQDFVGLGLTDALDVEQLFLGSVGHSFDGVETCVLQLLDVTGTDATLLHMEASGQTHEDKIHWQTDE